MPAEVIHKEADLGGRDGSNWIVAISVAGYGELDLRVRHATWESVDVGDRLDVAVRKGLIGFYVLTGSLDDTD